MFATLYKPLSESESTWSKAKITDIFKIISYNYTKKFYEVGSFSMVIPVNEPSVGMLETNTFLATNEGDYLFVTGIKETENRITLEGYDLKYLLAGRVTLFPTEAQDVGAYGYYVTKGTTGECICDIVNHNIAEATDPNRRIYGFSVNSAPVGIANDTYMTRLEPLDQVVGTLCKNAGIGYDVEMRFDPVFGDSIAFRVIKPTDRSENQTNVPKVIFSKRFLNVETLSREIGVDAEKNAIYAVNGTNIDDAIVKLVNRGGEDRANYGVYRRETTVNVNCDIDEIDSYALKETEDFVAADSFVMDVMASESYKREWFVGDIVTFRHKGLSRNAPIIAAEIQRTADKFTVKLSAGETKKKPVSAISKKADRASKENTQRKFDDVNVTTVKNIPADGGKNKIYVLEIPQNRPKELIEAETCEGYIFIDGKWKKLGVNSGANNTDTGDFNSPSAGSGNANHGMMSTICSGTGNTISTKGTKRDNACMFIGSGSGNKIINKDNDNSKPAPQYSAIANGTNNIIFSPECFIGSGNGIRISIGSEYSAIIDGLGNLIEKSPGSFIGSGCENKINLSEGKFNSVVGGVGNKILGKTSCSTIAGGQGNEIYGDVYPQNYSFVGCGLNNKITNEKRGGFSGFHAVCGGCYHIVDGVVNFVGSGKFFEIESNSSAILTGVNNKIKKTGIGGENSYIFIGTGSENTIAASENSPNPSVVTIINGIKNTIKSADYALIGTGCDNTIGDESSNSVILSGIGNSIYSNSAFIGHGSGNSIIGASYYSAILSGVKNSIIGALSVIIGGCNNKADNDKCLLFGEGLTTDGDYQTIFGCHNKPTDGKAIFVIGNGTPEHREFDQETGKYVTIPAVQSNAVWVTKEGDIYARSFNIIGESALEVSAFSSKSAYSPDLSELAKQIRQMKEDIKALKSENQALKSEISSLK